MEVEEKNVVDFEGSSAFRTLVAWIGPCKAPIPTNVGSNVDTLSLQIDFCPVHDILRTVEAEIQRLARITSPRPFKQGPEIL